MFGDRSDDGAAGNCDNMDRPRFCAGDARANVAAITNTTPRRVFSFEAGSGPHQYGSSLEARHLDTVVVTYADGHVKPHRLESLLTPSSRGTFWLKNWTIQED